MYVDAASSTNLVRHDAVTFAHAEVSLTYAASQKAAAAAIGQNVPQCGSLDTRTMTHAGDAS